MKTNIKKELHAKSITELRRSLEEAKGQERVLKLDHQMGKIKNTSSVRSKRLEIAVMSTILNEKLTEEKLANVAKTEQEKEVLKKEKPMVKNTKAKLANKKPASAKAIAGKSIRQAQGKGGKK